MSILQSIFLGILQGLTEFLPVSSSGHLMIAQKLFKLQQVPVLFDVFLHLATLLAVCIFFRKTIFSLIGVLIRWILRKNSDGNISADGSEISPVLCENDEIGRKTILMIMATTFVTGVLGIATEKVLPEFPVKMIFAGFLATSALLIFSSVVSSAKSKKAEIADSADDSEKTKSLSLKQALFIGFAQGVGTLPGISRSGSTIAGGLFSGVDRRTAGDYSFIVSIPAILAAFLLELKDLGEVSESIGWLQVAFGCVFAFVSGYLALAFLMKLVRKGKLAWFAAYLIPLAILGFVFF